MTVQIVESRGEIIEDADTGDLLVQYLTPGKGSSGYYAPDVVKESANSKLYPKGMQLYVDHPAESERVDRPERSVRDIAALSVTEGVWDDRRKAVTAKIKILPHFGWLRDADLRSAIGLSIRGAAEMTEGDVEGQRMPVVEKITRIFSVDFVTHAGRGGAILESMRTVEEISSNDRRQQLETAVTEKYGAEKTWIYVRDFDEEAKLVFFSITGPDESRTIWQESYTPNADDLGVSLSGNRVEVRLVTSYVPVKATIEAAESRSEPVAEITEAQHQQVLDQLAEAQRRVADFERAEEARKAEDKRREHRGAAERVAREAMRDDRLPESVVTRVVERAMIGIDFDQPVNEAAVRESTQREKTAELAYLRTFTPSPTLTGGGASLPGRQLAESGQVTREAADAAIANAFGHKTQKG